jgi:Family of unknown function (DUF6039)
MTEHTAARTVPAAHQTSVEPAALLHSANAGLIVERVAQIKGGMGAKAREASRRMVEHINAKHAGMASVFVYEETFGVKDRLHWLLHMRSLEDYTTLLRVDGGGDFRNGVFANPYLENWDEYFVDGSVRETVMHPHRWGMHGTLTEAMAGDPQVSPNVMSADGPRFVVTPAQAQTTQRPEDVVHSANAGVIMRRSCDFNYSFRDEARVFARTIAENVNLSMHGLASVFLYEEDFGRMDRVHWLIHMKSMSMYYLLMGLDARTDPDAPRASYIQDWISMDKGGGSWDRILVQGSVRDLALTPQFWGG